jgi:hypothetical protein
VPAQTDPLASARGPTRFEDAQACNPSGIRPAWSGSLQVGFASKMELLKRSGAGSFNSNRFLKITFHYLKKVFHHEKYLLRFGWIDACRRIGIRICRGQL